MIRPQTLAPWTPAWPTPTPEEVQEIRTLIDWPAARVAAHVGVDPRTWRRWADGSRHMPYAPWRLAVQAAGLATE